MLKLPKAGRQKCLPAPLEEEMPVRSVWRSALCAVLLALSVCICNVAFAAGVEPVYSDGYFYYHKGDGYVSICGYFGSEETVEIPSSIIALPVSRIEAGAFDGCDTVKEIILPDTIMEVQDGAFSGASNLVSVKDYEGGDVPKDTGSDSINGGSTGTLDTTGGSGASDNAGGSGSSEGSGTTSSGTTSPGSASSGQSSSAGSSSSSGSAANVGEMEYTELDDEAAAQAENEKNLAQIEAALSGGTTSDESAADSDGDVSAEETAAEGTPVGGDSNESSSSESDSRKDESGVGYGVLAIAAAVVVAVAAFVVVRRKKTGGDPAHMA